MSDLKGNSGNELQRKLTKAIEEHTELKVRVDELSGREIITPEEEVELKRLRKVKLMKKDMIAYLTNISKNKA